MIYLDHAATTPLDPRVLEAMLPHLRDTWGNPSSPHAKGRAARTAIDNARQQTADLMGVRSHEVIFTASGSEANSLALFGRAEQWQAEHGQPGHLIISSIEHSCSLKSADRLKARGWQVTALPVDSYGQVSADDLEQALTDQTAIVSLHWANNEVGSIQPIEDIARICQEHGVPLHCDAVQGIGLLPLPSPLPDLVTIAAHKFYGPKGIAALIVRDTVELKPQILGGGQEFGLRGGTENTAGIIGQAAALQIALAEQAAGKADELRQLRDTFVDQLTALPGASLNGHPQQRLCNFANIHFAGHDAGKLIIQLDMADICASPGAACVAGASEPSHVLQAMGQSASSAGENIRFTLGRNTTADELRRTVEVLSNLL